MKSNPSVAVVGGGPGGLFCAYMLNQKVPGADITIFEASSRLGGKIITDEFSDGSPFEAGVAELYEYLGSDDGDPMRKLIEDDLGLKTVNMGGGGVVLRGKILRDYDELGEKYGKEVQECVEKFYAKCAELMPLEDYANRWQPNNSHPWANKTFRECIAEETGECTTARDYIEAACASDLATESHTCNGLNGIKNVLMDNDKYMQVYHVIGGIDKIPEALVEKIQAKIETQARVIAIAKEWGDGNSADQIQPEYLIPVEPEVGDERYVLTVQDSGEGDVELRRFDAVFVCLPNHWLTQIKWSAGLRESIHRILEHYDLPAHYLRVSMLFDEAWWDKYDIPRDFWMMDILNGCCVYNEKNRWRTKGGNVLSFLIAGQDALLMASNSQSNREIVNYVLDSMPAKMRSQARRHLRESSVDRFIGSINAQPGGWPTKDLLEEHRPAKDHPDFYLVGDYLFDSTLNAAFISANTATNLFMERMGLEWKKANLTKAIQNMGGPNVPLSVVTDAELYREFL